MNTYRVEFAYAGMDAREAVYVNARNRAEAKRAAWDDMHAERVAGRLTDAGYDSLVMRECRLIRA